MRGFAGVLLLMVAKATAAQTLCSAEEVVVFSCAVRSSGKIVSLCASKDLAHDRGSLSYRFGQLGKVELQFPRNSLGPSASQFRYAHYFRYRVDRTELGFRSGDYEYSVFSHYDEDTKPTLSEGVNITRAQRDIQLLCARKAITNFAPLEEAVPCDRDNALASCR